MDMVRPKLFTANNLTFNNYVSVSSTTIVIHNIDRLEIYENPLIECTITHLIAHLEKPT